MDGIRQWHSEDLITQKIRILSEKLAALHDTGKGSGAFQEYIESPETYAGDPKDKAHTPLSLFLTLSLARKEAWPASDTIILAASACGHHGKLPYLPPGKSSEDQSSSGRLDDFAGGRAAKILKRQIAALNIPSLEKATGLSFSTLDLSAKSIRDAAMYLRKKIMPEFHALAYDESVEKAIDFRLKAQLVFSFLLEADKAFLAVPDPKIHLERKPRYWRSEWVDWKIGKCGAGEVNRLRKKARTEVLAKISEKAESGIHSMTAPTGIGKTLLAATWALLNRERIQEKTDIPPKIIVVLPFLSIIDQTAKEYRELLEAGGQEPDGSWFLISHSLSDRKYAPWMEEKAEPFFIDTWRTELVITTYDQFLMSLLEPRAKYQMRFHNLCDALIIMDEVQSLPCKLWKLLSAVLRGLARTGNSQILLMSATLPPFVSETIPLLENCESYFKAFSRYELRFQTEKKRPIQDFCEDVAARLPDWLNDRERVLITLNTRKSARMVYDRLKDHWPEEHKDISSFFISADVTPKDRLKKISLIKECKPCVVVSTQCIEAGVDIDMGRVIRDFAPWDSIVQIAGRCNREGKLRKRGVVEIVNLVNENGCRYSKMIYDDVSLQATRELTESETVLKEEDVLTVSDRYFKMLDSRKDTGEMHLTHFVRWQEDISVRELLRGEEREQYSFLVAEQDPSLEEAMKEANHIEDRWDRREAWRRLSGRIARISVHIYARPGFHCEEIATEFSGQWILKDGYYDSDRGIVKDNKYA